MKNLFALKPFVSKIDTDKCDDILNKITPIVVAALYNYRVVPIRLKILLEIIFSNILNKQTEILLNRVGWTFDEFSRGYINNVNFLNHF